MTTVSEPADPLAKGIVATAKQSWSDLFRWKQRVLVTNELGESDTVWQSPEKLRNPVSLLMMLSARDWIYFLVGLFAWTADAFDFHALAIQTVKLSRYYERSKTDITTAITLTLLLRSVGAAVFGLLGDRFGRKWPMVTNLIFLGLLQIATIYSVTFQQFLAVRSLFGLFMGGVYGNAVAMALENCPTEARGLMSGILQQGYALGYVLAACANLGVGGDTDTWKTVFWIASGLSIGAGLLRCVFPESRQFIEAKDAGQHITANDFWKETKSMIAKEWRMCVYCVFLMTWFNYYAHASQDSYTTFMLESKELPNDAATRASILMNTGACVGGTIVGYLSQFIGRRRAIIGAALISCCLIPAWILPSEESGLSASGFAIQFFVQGAWGVIPIHLNELSPPAYRSTFPGLAYQLGNLVSSPAAQIVNAIAESHFVTGKSGKLVDGYGPTMGIALAIVAVGITITTALGPERRGRSFEDAGPAGANTYNNVGKVVDNGSITDSTRVRDAEKFEV
ncbi:MFS general substrate transporter [Daldinia caldariorum]|uniref:MFS general substrate transporter n=1 Tax=Daldinia caldariorum TaxID=326644 RepID=UPI0020089BE8|nr:MFS general substrate transporter [Daldinia caldariorum]KAI1463249.1 MFS general substrate transporter [Daldinia caldariorum]